MYLMFLNGQIKVGSAETARHQTQSTPAFQPGYSSADAAYNNQPVLTFDGDRYLDSRYFCSTYSRTNVFALHWRM